MKETPRVNFALCWHMHQPWYQCGLDGDYQLPWVYLHAIKDYSDMVAHLEAHPGMKLTVNFAPVLLEQLDDYAKQLKQWLNTGTYMRDPMLNMLAGAEPVPLDPEQRNRLLDHCQRANASEMIDPYPAFRRLIQPQEIFLRRRKKRNTMPVFFSILSHSFLSMYWSGTTLPGWGMRSNKRRQYNDCCRKNHVTIWRIAMSCWWLFLNVSTD